MSIQQVILFQVWFTVVLNLVGLATIHGVAIDGRNVRSRPDISVTRSRFTAQEAQDIVDKHNEFRSNAHPPAADMRFLNWHDSLADTAQRYAEECIWDHGQVETINTTSFYQSGQNLWLAPGRRSERVPNGLNSLNAWYNEVENYDYSNNECIPEEMCGHYKQVVWSDYYAVGCGRNFCDTYVDPSRPEIPLWTNAWIIVCNYGPKGNVFNQIPYVEGTRCRNCPRGFRRCHEGLCRPFRRNEERLLNEPLD